MGTRRNGRTRNAALDAGGRGGLRRRSGVRVALLLRLAVVVATAFFVVAIVVAAAEHAPPSPPPSGLVMEMALLSSAMYDLRNRVESCDDPRARDAEVVQLVARARRKGEGEGGRLREGGIDAEADADADTAAVKRVGGEIFYDESDEYFDAANDADDLFSLILPRGCVCVHYSHDRDRGTQILVVRSDAGRYAAAAYAGTDDFTTALSDGDILESEFGPADVPNDGAGANDTNTTLDTIFGGVPKGVRVHRGFNGAVFDNGNFVSALQALAEARSGGGVVGGRDSDGDSDGQNQYRLLTTGHSLGAADSILLGAALALEFLAEDVVSINFGCPKVGNAYWREWVLSLAPATPPTPPPGARAAASFRTNGDAAPGGGGLQIYRFVLGMDIVSRLPEFPFFHVGHTVQLGYHGAIKAYYEHVGDEDLGYRGVPFGWGAAPYVVGPLGLYDHFRRQYLIYLEDYRPKRKNSDDPSVTENDDDRPYFDHFERTDEGDDYFPPDDPPIVVATTH